MCLCSGAPSLAALRPGGQTQAAHGDDVAQDGRGTALDRVRRREHQGARHAAAQRGGGRAGQQKTVHAEQLAGEFDVEVGRAKVSLPALARAATEEGVVFAGSLGGGYIFPEFLPAFDAVMSLGKLLDLDLDGYKQPQMRRRIETFVTKHGDDPVAFLNALRTTR